jgi:hypothetical protein
MPCYFFNIHDGDHFTPDHLGWNWTATEAKKALPIIVKDEGWTGPRADYALAGPGRPLGHRSVVSVSERAYSQACSWPCLSCSASRLQYSAPSCPEGLSP